MRPERERHPRASQGDDIHCKQHRHNHRRDRASAAANDDGPASLPGRRVAGRGSARVGTYFFVSAGAGDDDVNGATTAFCGIAHEKSVLVNVA